jgi:hypothetical protein
MPTLKEMKQRLQQARFGGEIPKVRSCARTKPRFCPLVAKMLTKNVLTNRAQELFNKQKLQEKVDEQRRAGAKNARDAYPSITVAPGVGDLHKRSLEHAKRYTERVQQEQKK